MRSQDFVKAYTCTEIQSHCCCLHVKFDHPINQNDDVPMHVGQNIGTEMPFSLPPDMEWECSGSALGRVLDSRQRGRGFEPHRCLEQGTLILA